MARSDANPAPVIITAARHPRSLDVETRQRRYLISMLVRTVLFVGAFFVPGVGAKVVCALGAAIIPTIAVMLANASDNHKDPAPDEPEADLLRPALTSGVVIRGDIVEDRGAGSSD